MNTEYKAEFPLVWRKSTFFENRFYADIKFGALCIEKIDATNPPHYIIEYDEIQINLECYSTLEEAQLVAQKWFDEQASSIMEMRVKK